jgi:hypothetical protein
MRTTMILITGAVFSLAAFGAHSFTAERYRAKYGRSTAAEEARKNTAAQREASACCRTKNDSFNNARPLRTYAETFFHAKYGRNAAAAEAREKLAAEESAKHVHACTQLGKCILMQAHARPVRTGPVAQSDTWRETFFHAKYGLTFPVKVAHSVLLSAAGGGCEHECCKRGD